MSDYESVIRLADHVDELTRRYINGDGSEDAKAEVTNLAGIYVGLTDIARRLGHELQHWATDARDARNELAEESELRAMAEDRAEDALADNKILALEIAEMARENTRLKAAVECPEHPDNEGEA